MNFEDYIQVNKVILAAKDFQKAKALVKMSAQNISAINNLKISKNTATILFTSHYESFRQIIEAIALCRGYKIYSYEAFTAFLEKLEDNTIAHIFDRMRKLRNGANYYGKNISHAVCVQGIKDLNKSIVFLKLKYLNNL